jgi:threonylcarbamoyladenosine tRNA methylthiotransferase MtaB
MRVYLETLGCRLNYAEMAYLARQLTGAGHMLAASADQADLCVLNSCAVTGDAARKSRQLAKKMARANPGARLLVTGCYATLEGEMVAALPNVALVVGNAGKDQLLAMITDLGGQALMDDPVRSSSSETGGLPNTSCFGIEGRTRAFVKVQDGCHNRCTFCIVAVARGGERSQSIQAVVNEINGLHTEGYQEAVLTGVHLGAYGRDSGTDLRALVSAVLKSTVIPRLRLSSLEPFDLAPDFFDLWRESEGRLMPHLHLPAQSGSDAVVRRMARRNSVAGFEALALAARMAVPGLTITTDLIAGFPGETEADFEETMSFARRVGFAHIHVFPYSARAGTAAARFEAQVSEAERRRRGRILAGLDSELGHRVRRSFLGDTRPVLWENSMAGVNGAVRWTGLTDNYLRVLAEVPAGVDLHDRISAVRLVRLDGDDLWGEIV